MASGSSSNVPTWGPLNVPEPPTHPSLTRSVCARCVRRYVVVPEQVCQRANANTNCTYCQRVHHPCRAIPERFNRAVNQLQAAADRLITARNATPLDNAAVATAQADLNTLQGRLNAALTAYARRRAAATNPNHLRLANLYQLETMNQHLGALVDTLRYQNRLAPLPVSDYDEDLDSDNGQH